MSHWKSNTNIPPAIASTEKTLTPKENSSEKSSSSDKKLQKNTSFNTPIRNPLKLSTGIDSEETILNPAIQDFASKLSKSLKSLKPIK